MKQAITKLLVPFVFASGLAAQNNATLYNISTVAGSVPSLTASGPANQAFLQEADGVAVDPNGNIYVSDAVNGVIRKISAGTSTVSTFLYLGTSIYGLATDSAGNVYAAVSGWGAIIKCGPNCNSTGVVASATAPFSGGAYVFVAGGINHNNGFAGDGGLAAPPQDQLAGRSGYMLNAPHGVALDAAGNIYVADTSNNRIRKIDTAGIIHTIAGTGASTAPVLAPTGTATVQIPYTCANAQVTTVNNSTTIGTTYVNLAPTYLNVGDGCLATQAILNGPWGVVVDPTGNGNIYAIDTGNNRVRSINPQTQIITTIAGNGLATGTTAAYAAGPTNLSLGDGQTAVTATFKTPYFGVIDANGNLFVSDNGNTRVRRINNGVITSYSGGSATSNGLASSTTFTSPRGVALDNSGNLLVADGTQLKSVDPVYLVPTPILGRAAFGGDGGPATSAVINGIAGGVAVDAAGNVYIADTSNNRIREVTGGTITTIAGSGTAASYTAATTTGIFSTTSGDNGPASSSRVNSPGCVAVDTLGNIYFADKSDNRIRKITQGIITTIVGPSQGPNTNPGYPIAVLNTPQCVAVDRQGNVYFTEGNAVQKLNFLTNTVSVIAGQPSYLANTVAAASVNNGVISPAYVTGVGTTVTSGPAGNDGDGTLAVNALLNAPVGLAVDNSGNIFIADKSNNEIREVNAVTGIITTIVGTISSGSDDGQVPSTAAATLGALGSPTQPAFGGRVNVPQGVAVDSSGNIYIANTGSNYIDKIDTNGNLIRIAGNTASGNPVLVQTGSANGSPTQPGQQILSPQAITVDAQGNVYFSDRIGLVRKLTPVNAK